MTSSKAARSYTVKRSGKTHYTKSQRRRRIAQARDDRRMNWGIELFECTTELEYRQWCHPFMRQREEKARG